MPSFRTNRFLAAVALCFSTALADQIVLKNGDRITGGIVKQDGKTITIKSDNFGVITAPWPQVVSITVEKPLTVVTGGKTVLGTLATTDGKVEVTTAGAKLTVAPADVATIRDAAEEKTYERLLRPGWLDLWSGTGSLGFSGTNGNAKTLTFTTGATAARTTNTDKTTITFNAIKASALANGVTSETAEAVRGGIAYDHNVGSRLFVSVFNDYEFDKFQSLDLRFTIGGGAGFHAIKSERSKLDLTAGGDYNHSSFNTGLHQSLAEIYWGDDYSFKMNARTSLVQSFRMFNDMTNTGNFRVNGDLTMSTKLTKWLNWNLSLSDRFLSDPVPGRKTNDWLYTTGVGVSFARQ